MLLGTHAAATIAAALLLSLLVVGCIVRFISGAPSWLSSTSVADPASLAKGDRIMVFWPAMQEWYAGTIKAKGVQDGVLIHRILYDDKVNEWRALSDAEWKRLPPRPPAKARAATSPAKRAVAAPSSAPPTPPARPKLWRLSLDASPSKKFQALGYELHAGLLDEAAMAALRDTPLGVTRPINGESARRLRPLEAEHAPHSAVLRCLDAFLSPRGLLASEPSILMTTSAAKRQGAHRDRGHGSLLAALHDGTHLWVAPGSHLQPYSDPRSWEHKLRRVDIPRGSALLFDPDLVHAGGDATCPPRVHSYTIPREREPHGAHALLLGGAKLRMSQAVRGDFGDL